MKKRIKEMIKLLKSFDKAILMKERHNVLEEDEAEARIAVEESPFERTEIVCTKGNNFQLFFYELNKMADGYDLVKDIPHILTEDKLMDKLVSDLKEEKKISLELYFNS